jgi:hypothetical protein
MNARNSLALLVLASIALTSACSGGGGGDDKTSFQGFVQNLATTPVDNADPVAIDGLEFAPTEDPAAFDALFQ